MKQLFIHKHDNPRRVQVVTSAMAAIDALADLGQDFQITIDEIKRTLDQNAAMWPSLSDFQKTVQWVVTDQHGRQTLARTEDVKDILTAAFEGETRMAAGLNGGVVFLGARTSQYSKRKMGEFLTFLHAEGDQRGVVWSKKAKDDLEFYAGRKA